MVLERSVIHCWACIRFNKESTECNRFVINIFWNTIISGVFRNCEDIKSHKDVSMLLCCLH